ncbi:MAG TPA: hypothetical protein VFD03_03765 [Clostridia bacterium]|nr:hypothetical protein [Clostridia bacterium]
MINYSELPQRVRRIVSQYSYCIENVEIQKDEVGIKLKEGYKAKEETVLITKNMEEAIYFLKSVTKPPSRDIVVAMFSFKCQLNCGNTIQKGSNYVELGGMRLCNYCGGKD